MSPEPKFKRSEAVNLAPLLAAELAVQVHVAAAILALMLGTLVLWRKKGGTAHKAMGRLWVGLMLIVAVSSFFIHEIRMWGDFSPINILSILVVGSLGQALWAIRNGNIAAHRTAMRSTYFGGLLLAGGFTLVPDRLMYRVVLQPLFPEGFQVSVDTSVIVGLLFAIVLGLAIWERFSRKQAAR